MKSRFVIVSDAGFFGLGDTLKQAAENCLKEGDRKTSKGLVAYCYTGKPEELKDVFVTSYGDISHPQTVVSTRLFGPVTKISLGQLVKDLPPR